MESLIISLLVTVIGGLLVGLVLYYVFGIGKNKTSKKDSEKTFKLKFAEEEITFMELMRSLKMDVIKINAHDHTLGIRAEYAWMEKEYPKSKTRGQSLKKIEIDSKKDKKRVIMFDIHKLQILDGREKQICFEISSFFTPGKADSLKPGYVDQKLKDLYTS